MYTVQISEVLLQSNRCKYNSKKQLWNNVHELHFYESIYWGTRQIYCDMPYLTLVIRSVLSVQHFGMILAVILAKQTERPEILKPDILLHI